MYIYNNRYSFYVKKKKNDKIRLATIKIINPLPGQNKRYNDKKTPADTVFPLDLGRRRARTLVKKNKKRNLPVAG